MNSLVVRCVLLAGSLVHPAPAAAQAERMPDAPDAVVVTRIKGMLDESMYVTLERAITRAEQEHAAALIVEIDTPGGEVMLMDRLGLLVGRAPIRTIAFVTNEAVSAGAYIAMACERIYTLEHAQIGSSFPVAIGPFGMPGVEVDPGIREKQLSYLRSKFRSMAEGHDRPGMTALAQAMVDPSIEVLLVADRTGEQAMTRAEYQDAVRQQGESAVRIVKTICAEGRLLNLTAAEAFEYGFSDGVVHSRDELLDAIGLSGAAVVEVWPSWSERLAGYVDTVKWLLIVAGIVLLYVEMKIPGFGLPGVLGIACIGLVLVRNFLVGLADLPEVLLVIAGIVLLAIEILVFPGFGIAGTAGVASVALGLLFSFLPFVWPSAPGESELLAETLRGLSLTLVAALIGAFVLSRYVLPRTPLFARLILDRSSAGVTLEGSAVAAGPDAVRAGDEGHAATDLRPAGKVDVAGGLLEARSEGEYVARGSRVVVVEVLANHVVVRAARGTAG